MDNNSDYYNSLSSSSQISKRQKLNTHSDELTSSTNRSRKGVTVYNQEPEVKAIPLFLMESTKACFKTDPERGALFLSTLIEDMDKGGFDHISLTTLKQLKELVLKQQSIQKLSQYIPGLISESQGSCEEEEFIVVAKKKGGAARDSSSGQSDVQEQRNSSDQASVDLRESINSLTLTEKESDSDISYYPPNSQPAKKPTPTKQVATPPPTLVTSSFQVEMYVLKENLESPQLQATLWNEIFKCYARHGEQRIIPKAVRVYNTNYMPVVLMHLFLDVTHFSTTTPALHVKANSTPESQLFTPLDDQRKDKAGLYSQVFKSAIPVGGPLTPTTMFREFEFTY
ncbi:hypothetical protein FGO68_gene3371 [Halteria grandinella]|uniref:Uncharacterized protein n=1 Tax=Halteria grandinella TaxID=5974 RepID=A0A8J8NRF4_HALGN|nr:hypothetical protein FGO68_gene3371 [Halteria grandinella]